MSDVSKLVKALRSKKLDVSTLADDNSPCVVHQWVSTGCLALDKILGGGLPVGRMVEVFGDPSSGKSLIAAQVVAQAQSQGLYVGYADTEASVSIPIMEMVGVNTKELIYASPDTIEEVFTFFDEAIQAKNDYAKDSTLVLIWDSIAASSSEVEMENEYGKATMGRHAQLISQALRKFMHIVAKDRVCLLFLNQVRQKIGVMFGDNETTFGGMAVSFHASIRVKLDIAGKITNSNKKVIGMNTIAKVVKSKVSMPFQKTLLPVYFGEGINDAEATFEYLKDHGLITVSGNKHKLLDVTGEILDEGFSRKSWPKMYNDNYDTIADIIKDVE